MDAGSPVLPTELILRIIECLDVKNVLVLDTRKDVRAKSILAFTRVSRATYPVALRMLYRRCLWIDSSERLRLLLISLEVHTSSIRPMTSTLPLVRLQDCLHALFLAPFKRSLDDLPTAHWIFELFAAMRHSLRRLAIDMPLRSLYPEDDHLNVRPKLRAAFEELTALEEFTSINDELFLSTQEERWTWNHESPVWSKWHSLKHLALYNIDLDNEDFEMLPLLSRLRSLVLVRPDSSEPESWLSLLRKFKQPHLTIFEIDESRSTERSCGLGAVRLEYGSSLDLQSNVDLVPISVPYACACGDHPKEVVEVVKTWVKDRVIDGSLWHKNLLLAAVAQGQQRAWSVHRSLDCQASFSHGSMT